MSGSSFFLFHISSKKKNSSAWDKAQLAYSEQGAQVCNIITTERLEERSHEALFVTPTVTVNSISEPQKGNKKISL